MLLAQILFTLLLLHYECSVSGHPTSHRKQFIKLREVINVAKGPSRSNTLIKRSFGWSRVGTLDCGIKSEGTSPGSVLTVIPEIEEESNFSESSRSLGFDQNIGEQDEAGLSHFPSPVNIRGSSGTPIGPDDELFELKTINAELNANMARATHIEHSLHGKSGETLGHKQLEIETNLEDRSYTPDRMTVDSTGISQAKGEVDAGDDLKEKKKTKIFGGIFRSAAQDKIFRFLSRRPKGSGSGESKTSGGSKNRKEGGRKKSKLHRIFGIADPTETAVEVIKSPNFIRIVGAQSTS